MIFILLKRDGSFLLLSSTTCILLLAPGSPELVKHKQLIRTGLFVLLCLVEAGGPGDMSVGFLASG